MEQGKRVLPKRASPQRQSPSRKSRSPSPIRRSLSPSRASPQRASPSKIKINRKPKITQPLAAQPVILKKKNPKDLVPSPRRVNIPAKGEGRSYSLPSGRAPTRYNLK